MGLGGGRQASAREARKSSQEQHEKMEIEHVNLTVWAKDPVPWEEAWKGSTLKQEIHMRTKNVGK